MLLNLQDQLFLLWVISLWFCIKAAHSDALPYGERIRPLKGIVNKVLQVSQCDTAKNQTACIKNEHFIKIKNVNTGHQHEDSKQSITSEPRTVNLHTVNPLEKTQQTASPIYSGFPKENINNKGATFFFTQVEPHRYEYRAMFQHQRNNFHQTELFQPFVHNFEPFSRDFPPLPKFPVFPEFPKIFPDHKDPFPNFHEFTFPTLPPAIKRVWEPESEVQTQRPILNENFDGPLMKKYDVILGHNRYPKIFRFNEERINIEDFDREKKLKLYKLSKDGQNELLEPENVKRDQLLILHGGIFTVQEPPLYNKHVKKIRKSRIFGTKVS